MAAQPVSLASIPVYNWTAFNADPTGVRSSDLAIAAMLAEIGTSNREMVVPPGTYKISQSVTFPANISIRFEEGAQISVDAGVTVTMLAGFTGALRRIFSGSGAVSFTGNTKLSLLYPEWWGALCDGLNASSPTNTTAIQGAATAASTMGGGVVRFQPGTYVTNNIDLPSNVILEGAGWGTILKTVTGATEADRAHYLLSINRGAGGTADPDNNIVNITIRDLQLRGTVDVDAWSVPNNSEHKHLMNINAASHVLIDHVKFVGWRGDAIYIGSSNDGNLERHNTDIVIEKCYFDGLTKDNRNGISIIQGENITVEGNTFTRCTRSNMPGPIDVEPDAGTVNPILRNIRIINNYFTDNGGDNLVTLTVGQGGLTTILTDFTIAGNIFESDNDNDNATVFIRGASSTDGVTPNNNFQSASSVNMGILVEGNAFRATTGIASLYLSWLTGARVVGNTFQSAPLIEIGNIDIAGATWRNVSFEGNTLVGGGSGGAHVEVASGSYLSITGNLFDRPATGISAIIFAGGAATTASDYVSINANRFIKGGSQTHSVYSTNHTQGSAANNRYFNNVVSDTSLLNLFRFGLSPLVESRAAVANTAGSDLTLQAGGATVGATDKKGGDLILAPGPSTGLARSSVRIQAGTIAAASGTTDNVQNDRLVVTGERNLTKGVTAPLVDITLPPGAMAGGALFYTIRATDGTDMQVYTGVVSITTLNKAGVYTSQAANNAYATSYSTGNMVVTFAVGAGVDMVNITVNAVPSITPTRMTISFTYMNHSPQALAF